MSAASLLQAARRPVGSGLPERVVRQDDPEGPCSGLTLIIQSLMKHGPEHAYGVRVGFTGA